jgi:hypothetical protein
MVRRQAGAQVFENPMGTDGFEFVEYTAPDPALLRRVFAALGFPVVARHRSKDVTLHRQGDVIVAGVSDKATFVQGDATDQAFLSGLSPTGTFDLTTGEGTQTVVDCRGPALMCSDVVAGSEAPYTAQDLDASDPDAITWKVDVSIDLGSSFGTADSASRFTTTRED